MFRASLVGILVLVGAFPQSSTCFAQFDKGDWRVVEPSTDLTVGYAVHVCDLNGDGKTDFLVLDSRRVLAYLAPEFQPRELARDFAKPDLVCMTSLDVDRDGKLDLIIGADWKPFNTVSGGTIQWLHQPETLDQPWKSRLIGEEPTIHRMKAVDWDGDGHLEVMAVPLMGRDATAKANWMDGRPVRVLEIKPGGNPFKDPWILQPIEESQHVVHNFLAWRDPLGGPTLVTASYEGLSKIRFGPNGPKVARLHQGNQEKPLASRGCSEVARGKDKQGREMFATVEPWHGHQIVAYEQNPNETWNRRVVDEQLKWGHAVAFADIDGDGVEEIIAGIRDNLADQPGKRRGVRIYRRGPAENPWIPFFLEEGGVAVEDLVVADLNGDKKPDIIVSGRATKNVRIYFQK